MKIKLIGKKYRYAFFSILYSVLTFIFAYSDSEYKLYSGVALLVVCLLGTFISQTPNIKPKHLWWQLVVPLHLAIGTLLSMYFYPNLGLLIKVFVSAGLGFVFYILQLINNVFLVVDERKEIIPLYRACVTWIQIIISVVSIFYISGVFKLPLNPMYESVIMIISIILFVELLIHVSQYDNDIRFITTGERVGVALFVSFTTLCLVIGTGFIPSETFLRSLVMSANVMFMLGYVYAHFRNSIQKSFVTEYFIVMSLLIFIEYIFSA